jgi:hypothetical protein
MSDDDDLIEDFGRLYAKDFAPMDQALALFRDYYFAISEQERDRLRAVIRGVSEYLPVDAEGCCQLMSDIGCSAEPERIVTFSVNLSVPEQQVKIEPGVLKRAIDAWDNDLPFAPEAFWDLE